MTLPMGWILLALFVVLLATALWWLPAPAKWAVCGAAALVLQLFIWWVAKQIDNGVPWSLDRSLLSGSTGHTVLFALLLYGPLALGIAGIGFACRAGRRS